MRLKQCDAESEKIIEKMTSGNSPKSRTKKVQKSKNNPDFDVAQYLHAALGVDVTQIYGIKEVTALTIFSETGANLKERFPTEKQFLSWVNVVQQ